MMDEMDEYVYVKGYSYTNSSEVQEEEPAEPCCQELADGGTISSDKFFKANGQYYCCDFQLKLSSK